MRAKLAVAMIASLLTVGLTAIEAAAADQRRSREAPAAGAEREDPGKPRRRLLGRVKQWGIHLRRMEVDEIAASPFDLVVVDYAPYRHLSFEFPFGPQDVARMQRRPDGGRRLVLAYLSIGEAEDYRYYWNRDWRGADKRPAWLGAENPKWAGNFPVRFWSPEWQRIIMEGPQSYLARILAAGFDGVYLDRADVYEEWLKENPKAQSQMISFVVRLAEAAHRLGPDRLVVLQNAEELLANKAIRSSIDGFVKEDLFFGAGQSETANTEQMIAYSLKHLRMGRRSGLTILVLEYLSEPGKAAQARRGIVKEGFLPHIAERSLSTLTLRAPDEIAPGSEAVAPASRAAQ
jgi:cysteinyl-tRNA synthetase